MDGFKTLPQMVFFFIVYGSIWRASFQAKVLFCSKWVWVNQKRERERNNTEHVSYKDDVALGFLGYFCV